MTKRGKNDEGNVSKAWNRRKSPGFRPEAGKKLKERFEEIDRIAEYNQLKVIKAMQSKKSAQNVSWEAMDMGIMIWEGTR